MAIKYIWIKKWIKVSISYNHINTSHCNPVHITIIVIMSATAFQITGVSIVYSTVCSDAVQRKHQSSASLALMSGIHRWPVNSLHKTPVTQKMFHLMTSSWYMGPEISHHCASNREIRCWQQILQWRHMRAMVSQISHMSSICSTACSILPVLCRGNPRSTIISHRKGSVMRKCFYITKFSWS